MAPKKRNKESDAIFDFRSARTKRMLARRKAKDALSLQPASTQRDAKQAKIVYPPILTVFRFLDLPAELRNRIYEYSTTSGEVRSIKNLQRDCPLSAVNKQKVLPIFLSLNTFTLITSEVELWQQCKVGADTPFLIYIRKLNLFPLVSLKPHHRSMTQCRISTQVLLSPDGSSIKLTPDTIQPESLFNDFESTLRAHIPAMVTQHISGILKYFARRTSSADTVVTKHGHDLLQSFAQANHFDSNVLLDLAVRSQDSRHHIWEKTPYRRGGNRVGIPSID